MTEFFEEDEPIDKILKAFEQGEKGVTMEPRPTVLVPREASDECPGCTKKAYRRVTFSDGRTGWFCYACAHTVMVPGMKP